MLITLMLCSDALLCVFFYNAIQKYLILRYFLISAKFLPNKQFIHVFLFKGKEMFSSSQAFTVNLAQLILHNTITHALKFA